MKSEDYGQNLVGDFDFQGSWVIMGFSYDRGLRTRYSNLSEKESYSWTWYFLTERACLRSFPQIDQPFATCFARERQFSLAMSESWPELPA